MRTPSLPVSYLVEYQDGERAIISPAEYEHQTFETDDPPTILCRLSEDSAQPIHATIDNDNGGK
jgi:hypothetical protein